MKITGPVTGGQRGWPFGAAMVDMRLLARYGDRDAYLASYDRAARAAVDAGLLRPADAEQGRAEAAARAIAAW